MLITCLTCKTNENLLTLDEMDFDILDYLFHPHSTSYLAQLKGNEATQICTACRENIRDIDNFRKSALKNFLQLLQVWQITPSLKTSIAQRTTAQQDVMVEIQSPSLDSTVFVKTERSDPVSEDLMAKMNLDVGDDEEPQCNLSKMMLDNVLQGMYVAKTTATNTTVTEATVQKSAGQLNKFNKDDKRNTTATAQPRTDIVQRTSLRIKSVHSKKNPNDLAYRTRFADQRHLDERHGKFRCCDCNKTFRKKKTVQRLVTMWELARQPPPSDDQFYPKVIQLVHKHFIEGWKNWVINDLPYEDIFGKTVDPELEKKIRFLLPSVELMRAWRPYAYTASADTVRDMRRRLLQWSFGRSLIYAPKNISLKIHDNSYEFVAEVLAKLKPMFLPRKALAAALKESKVLEDRNEVSESPSTSGIKRVGDELPEEAKRKRNLDSDESE